MISVLLMLWLVPVGVAMGVMLVQSTIDYAHHPELFDHERLASAFAKWIIWPIILLFKILGEWVRLGEKLDKWNP